MLSLSLCQCQRESLRQILEEKIAQALKHRQVQKLELKLYLAFEDRFTALYREAGERGDLRQFNRHGLAFEYARVRRHEVPDVAETYGCGFAFCKFGVLRQTATWHLFVIDDFFAPLEFPETYIEYVAVHEHGEEVTMGMHELAIRLEFAIAKKERKLLPYLRWLDQHYVTRFTDVFSQHMHVILPDSEALQCVMEHQHQREYAANVREYIEKFEWPYRVLQKLSKYAKPD